MANLSVDQRTGKYTLRFRFAGTQYTRSCETESEKQARETKALLEQTIRLVKLGHVSVPSDADAGLWLMSGGKVATKPKQDSAEFSRLGEICEQYLSDQHDKAKNTLTGERVHIGHLKTILGTATKFAAVTVKDLQSYVNRRSKSKHRNKPISGRTIRKELVTFTQVWAWAKQRGYVRSGCPLINEEGKWAVEIAKPAEKEKFQTWGQIQGRIDRGGMTEAQQADLWASLFLDNTQVIGLLEHVKETARHAFIYPMFMFAAYTGARRSEICRSLIADFDFEHNKVKIREKKRRKSKSESYRFVDLHPRLKAVMQDWFLNHPGGQYAIAAPLAIAKRRTRTEFAETSPHEAHHHFKRTLSGSKWQVVRGFHVLRHSFGSNLARAGVPRDRIADWMGHTTQEMMDLYQHLFPQDGASQIAALN